MAATGNIDFKRTPSLGEGIYFADDVAAILCLKYHKVHHLMNTFWNCNTFGGNRNKAIHFFGLIEFYTYYHLRENGFSAQHIKSFHLGQPVINGTNLQTQTVFSLFSAGESKVNICRLYDINEKDVDEAIQFHESKAA